MNMKSLIKIYVHNAEKFDNLDEMGQFLKKHNLPKLVRRNRLSKLSILFKETEWMTFQNSPKSRLVNCIKLF